MRKIVLLGVLCSAIIQNRLDPSFLFRLRSALALSKRPTTLAQVISYQPRALAEGGRGIPAKSSTETQGSSPRSVFTVCAQGDSVWPAQRWPSLFVSSHLFDPRFWTQAKDKQRISTGNEPHRGAVCQQTNLSESRTRLPRSWRASSWKSVGQSGENASTHPCPERVSISRRCRRPCVEDPSGAKHRSLVLHRYYWLPRGVRWRW